MFTRYVGHHNPMAEVTTYYSIPYARAARFDFATPIDEIEGCCSSDVVNATEHGAACINFNLPPPYDKGFETLLGDEPIEPQSEDCLTMDIYVPNGDLDGLPVYCKILLLNIEHPRDKFRADLGQSTSRAAASSSAPLLPTTSHPSSPAPSFLASPSSP